MRPQEFVIAMLPHTKAEAVTDAVAVGALTSPFWLHDMAGVAKDVLPIAGVVWLLVQIGIKVYWFYKGKH